MPEAVFRRRRGGATAAPTGGGTPGSSVREPLRRLRPAAAAVLLGLFALPGAPAQAADSSVVALARGAASATPVTTGEPGQVRPAHGGGGAPAAVTVDAATVVDGGAASPMPMPMPRVAAPAPGEDGPIGLLALTAMVCLVGVSAGVIRAIIAERANSR